MIKYDWIPAIFIMCAIIALIVMLFQDHAQQAKIHCLEQDKYDYETCYIKLTE